AIFAIAAAVGPLAVVVGVAIHLGTSGIIHSFSHLLSGQSLGPLGALTGSPACCAAPHLLLEPREERPASVRIAAGRLGRRPGAAGLSRDQRGAAARL